MRQVLCVFTGVLIALGDPSAAEAQIDDDWRAFRDAHPYHIQAVALSEPKADGTRTVIISEPPRHFTALRIGELLPAGVAVQLSRQRIGYDGWVRDAVATLPPLDAGALRALIDNLHLHLFTTSYKAYAIPINGTTKLQPVSLDIDVSGAELERWLIPPVTPERSGGALLVAFVAGIVFIRCGWRLIRGERSARRWGLLIASALIGWYALTPTTPDDLSLRFARVGLDESKSGRDILRDKVEGVFVSRVPGIVLCAVSKAKPLSEYMRDLRQFSLDADLILGGVKSGDHVLIVGRERVAPVSVLPPLRTETVMLLASVKENELGQSYDRSNIYAGRFDGRRDWAPIYLSDALIDTEYGSLLNITDQLLKAWSMHGDVEYINFTAYPKPSAYPFPTSITEHTNATRITFNWNTKGAGYKIEGDVEIVALNRTGALPVDYLGESDNRLAEAEDVAYEYFARTGDPNLVRVVQYAALYQMFQDFGIATSEPTPPKLSIPRAAEAAAALVIDLVRDDDFADLRPPDGASDAMRQRYELLPTIHLALQSFLQAHGDAGLRRLIGRLAAPRNFDMPSGRDEDSLDSRAFRLASAMMQVGHVLRLAGLPLGAVLQSYVAHPRDGRQPWIRTPSVVISWIRPGAHSEGAVGGHNLSGKDFEAPRRTQLSSGVRCTSSNETVSGCSSFILTTPAACRGWSAPWVAPNTSRPSPLARN